MTVNLKSVFLGCKHGIPALLRAGGGSIVNTASFVAVMGAATSQIAYTASKGGVLAMTREIAVEYARRGIRANALCPGPVDTPLLAQLLAEPAARARRLVHVPMGRLAKASRGGAGGALPRLRRIGLRERRDLHGRRRHHRGLRHGGMSRRHARRLRPR